jgi:hypothetical protein
MKIKLLKRLRKQSKKEYFLCPSSIKGDEKCLFNVQAKKIDAVIAGNLYYKSINVAIGLRFEEAVNELEKRRRNWIEDEVKKMVNNRKSEKEARERYKYVEEGLKRIKEYEKHNK